MEEPLVSICCITYNHGKYIRECLEGFIMQQTSFKYEILVHDDASADDTQEIIKEYVTKYPDVIKPILQTENQYSKGYCGNINAAFNFPRARGKYIAMCEGDDYWIDPLKLQKQVKFLEQNTSCSMVFTGCLIKKSNGEKQKIRYNNLSVLTPDNYVRNSYFMATASLLFCRRVLDAPTEDWMRSAFAGDFILRYKALTLGSIGFINDITCVYNKGTAGSWSNRKLNKDMILKEFSDNLRGLYYLDKYKQISRNTKRNKIRKLREDAFFKLALVKGGRQGLLYLLANFKNTSPLYLGAYIKRLLR